MDTKAWYLSRTLWLNVVAVVAMVVANRGIVITDVAQVEIVGGILAVLNIILRLRTNQPIAGPLGTGDGKTPGP